MLLKLALGIILFLAPALAQIQTINNEAMSTARTKINNNFSYLSASKAGNSSCLTGQFGIQTNTSGLVCIAILESHVTGLVSDLASKASTNYVDTGLALKQSKSLHAVFTNSGSALTAATACGMAVSSGTLSQITLTSDGTAGNATVNLASETVSQYLAGTSATSMTNGHPVSFSAARGVQVSSFTGWTTTTITAGQVYCFALSSPSSILGLTVVALY